MQRLTDSFRAAFSSLAVENDVFYDHDGVVNDEADGCGEPTEGHEVEAFAEHRHEDEGQSDRGGDHETRDERGSPIAEEDDDDDGREQHADEDGVAYALDALADEFGLVVVGFECDARGKQRAKGFDLSGDLVGDLDGVARGLTRDVEQDGWFAVGAHHGVTRFDRIFDRSHVPQVNRCPACCAFNNETGHLIGRVDLAAHQAENEFMTALEEAGGVDQVRELDAVEDVTDSDAGGDERGWIGGDLDVGYLVALHDDGADAVEAVQRGLQLVGRDLPQLRHGDRVRREAVAQDRERGEGKAVGCDDGSVGQCLANFGEGGVDQLEGPEHIDIPVEEEADFG